MTDLGLLVTILSEYSFTEVLANELLKASYIKNEVFGEHVSLLTAI